MLFLLYVDILGLVLNVETICLRGENYSSTRIDTSGAMLNGRFPGEFRAISFGGNDFVDWGGVVWMENAGCRGLSPVPQKCLIWVDGQLILTLLFLKSPSLDYQC